MTEVHYEVQHFTLVDGWVNCWSTINDDDSETPTTYPTFRVAEQELREFLEERPEEDGTQWRIVEIRGE